MSKPAAPGWWWIRYYHEADAPLPKTVGPAGADGDVRECIYVYERGGRLMFESRYPPLGECPVDEFVGEFLMGEVPPLLRQLATHGPDRLGNR